MGHNLCLQKKKKKEICLTLQNLMFHKQLYTALMRAAAKSKVTSKINDIGDKLLKCGDCCCEEQGPAVQN